MENKYRNWCFTLTESDSFLLPNPEDIYIFLEKNYESFVFQLEKGEISGKLHYQGCFRTKIRTRHSSLMKQWDGVVDELCRSCLTIDKMEGTWNENVAYCTKEDTRFGDAPFFSRNQQTYTGRDITIFQSRKDWYSWQIHMFQIIQKQIAITNNSFDSSVNDRDIYWITDQQGNSGKSKFTKYLCHNFPDIIKVPFGSAAQIRSAVISAGPRKVYIMDIPRTLGEDDSIKSIISAIEDIKNGFVVSSFYGELKQLLFECPLVIIFSNEECPTSMMSEDRWRDRLISGFTKELCYKNHDGTVTPYPSTHYADS